MKYIGQKITDAGLSLFAVSIPISFVPAEFGIALACFGWIINGIISKSWKTRWHPFFIPLIAYLSWNVVAALLSERPFQSLVAVGDNEWPFVLMLMMFWTVSNDRTLKRLIVLFLASSAIAMFYAVWQTWYGVELYRNMPLTPIDGLYRNVGFYGFYLTFAGFAMSVFFLATSLGIEIGRGRASWYPLLSFLSLLAIIGSFARSVWLGIVIVLPVLGFLKGRKTGAAAVLSLLFLTTFIIVVSPTIRDRAFSILDPGQNQTRINLWKTSLAITKEHPVFGIGQDNFVYFFDRYRIEGYYDSMVHPHNDYLNVLVSSGLPGLLAFLSLWGMAVRVGLKTGVRLKSGFVRGTAIGATLGLLGFLIGSLFQNYYGTFANCLGWWFLVGIIFTASRLADNEDQRASASTASS
ncbi:MAG: O-antigen ligase family protein [Ignavibacteriales bacterium]|nr:O-antigen ligase family protein [Ignavibacteriales bacterium]